MASFMLVHGGTRGGYTWKFVRERLRTAGHEAYPPLLSSLSERSRLASPELGLDTQILDIATVLAIEDLRETGLTTSIFRAIV